MAGGVSRRCLHAHGGGRLGSKAHPQRAQPLQDAQVDALLRVRIHLVVRVGHEKDHLELQRPGAEGEQVAAVEARLRGRLDDLAHEVRDGGELLHRGRRSARRGVNSERRSYRRPKLRSRDFSRSVLEMMICSPLTLRSRVLLMPMCSTVPCMSSTLQRSPRARRACRARSTARRGSPRASVCTASASAMPPMPRPASSGPIWMPRLSSASSAAMPQMTTLAPNMITAMRAAEHRIRRRLRAAPRIDPVAHRGHRPQRHLHPEQQHQGHGEPALHARRRR